MIRLFEFLYYCLYRMFALVKRVGEKDENLASSFYGILLSTKAILLFAIFIRSLNSNSVFLNFPYNYIFKLFIILVFLLIYSMCKYYFIKKENYKRIIKQFENESTDKNKIIAILGILYSIFTFSIFIIIMNL